MNQRCRGLERKKKGERERESGADGDETVKKGGRERERVIILF